MKSVCAISFLTLVLVAFNVLLQSNTSVILLEVLYLLSPAAIIITFFIILTDKSQPYPQLGENDEWGYCDKTRIE